MDISEYFKHIGYDKIISYLRSVVEFYIKPKLFFKSFFEKNEIEKIRQIFFYLVIETIILFIFIESESLTHITKFILIDIIFILPLFLTLTSSEYITTKIFKSKKIELKDIFFYILLCKIFFEPFIIISLVLFIKVEYYEFYFAYNCFVVLFFYIIFILSAFLFFRKIKEFLTYIAFNILFLNVLFIPFLFISFDKYENNSDIFETDMIYLEYQNAKENISLPMAPQYKVIITKKDKIYKYLKFYDKSHINIIDINIQNDLIAYKKFKTDLNQTDSKIDSTIKKLKYKRNIQYFSSIKKYCDDLNLEIKRPIDSKKDYYRERKQMGNNTVFVFYTDTCLVNQTISILDCNNNFLRSKQISEYPYVGINFFIYPLEYIIEKHTRYESSEKSI